MPPITCQTAGACSTDGHSTDDPLATIHEPFFRGGILITLTLGAAWGAYLLWQIAGSGSFTAVSIFDVNAHGYAQIFGWLGLFVMGATYAMLPRHMGTTLAWPKLASASLWLLLGGLIGRSLLEPFAAGQPAVTLLAAGATLAGVAAIGLFAAVVGATIYRGPARLTAADGFVLAAVAWFILQAVWDLAYFVAVATAVDREHLLHLVATWQAPLREVQIHGFAMLMVLGVSQRLLPAVYGYRPVPRGTSLGALAALNLAVIAVTAGFLLMQIASRAYAGLWYAGVVLMAAAAGILVRRLGVFTTPAQSDPSLKLIRAAYAWLLISLAMLVLLPVYQLGLLRLLVPESEAARMGFSHAYYGAIRHAVTVGFLSQMILGVAPLLVARWRGLRASRRSGLWVPFLLLNAGCTLRVAGQTLTDFFPAAFAPTGISGVVELAALAVWGLHLWRMMAAEPAAAATSARAAPA